MVTVGWVVCGGCRPKVKTEGPTGGVPATVDTAWPNGTGGEGMEAVVSPGCMSAEPGASASGSVAGGSSVGVLGLTAL